ncbi:MAG: DUF2238 domain-containing protein [Verrucomicrobiales bacterium]|nr:DUF2238 domain-containing protein [Verrucomicrobiales bacterium]
MYAYAVLAFTLGIQVLLGWSPRADRLTWALENFPVWIGIVLVATTWKRFPLSRLCLTLLALHALILAVGGHWTYARVPAGDWVRDTFGLARNPYDRLGHVFQGFAPAILVRELLLRTSPLGKSRWLPFLTVCVCLAFSAFYELIEWWTALLTGSGANDFLGTQGDPWDTQWDMFLCACGALASLTLLSGVHDRSLSRLKPGARNAPGN